MGINVIKVRYQCVILGSMLAGLAGAYLLVAQANMFASDLIAGRGFIAIALVYFGRWKPFGAVLVDKNDKVILEQENIEITESDCTGHAETQLMVNASKKYSKDFLWDGTLYNTAEPCAMCAGSIYWGNIGRVVFGISEKNLLEITGNDEQNPTFDLPCREVFSRGQKEIEVIGPISSMKAQISELYEQFFKE